VSEAHSLSPGKGISTASGHLQAYNTHLLCGPCTAFEKHRRRYELRHAGQVCMLSPPRARQTVTVCCTAAAHCWSGSFTPYHSMARQLEDEAFQVEPTRPNNYNRWVTLAVAYHVFDKLRCGVLQCQCRGLRAVEGPGLVGVRAD